MFKYNKNWTVADDLMRIAAILLVLWCISLVVSVVCSETVATWIGFVIAMAAVVSFAITVILIAGKLYKEHKEYGW